MSMTDNVNSSRDANIREEIMSSQDHIKETNERPRFFLPPIPHLHSSLPSTGPLLSDQVYLQAAAIFQQLRQERTVTRQILCYGKKTDAPQPESRDKTTQRHAYRLVFNTLKYQNLLEDVIADSRFHATQHIPSDLLPLAMVMLFDFQDRKFLLRKRSSQEGEEPLQEVRDLENSLQRCKIRLAASLARCRVKLRLRTMSCFLSDHVRINQHRTECLPFYAWVNSQKASVEEVCEVLQSAGLCQVENMTGLRESTFCRDHLCPDTLVFPPQLHALLQNCSHTNPHVLNMQDRSVCVAVSALRPLLFEKGDVLVVGYFSALTVAHIAVAADARSGRVLVCGADHTPLQMEEIQEILAQMDIKKTFCGLHERDATVQRLKVILVLPRCSSSALNDPVPTIVSEQGEWGMLPDLSQGSVSQSKINTMAAQQARLLAHALSFPKVQTVLYCTRSVYPEENEQLVKRVLEKTHTHPKLQPFRVNGPIFPDESESGGTTDSKFLRLEPSEFTNGCFTARLSRQADPTKVETVQDVLARAAAKGLLGGIFSELSKQGKKGKKGKKGKHGAASASSGLSSPSDQEKQTGRENESLRDPENEEKNSECSEDEREEDATGKKRKSLKRKVKRKVKQTSSTSKVLKHYPKKHKRESKNKVKRRRRRIPRLTLSLMSSIKTSSHLSPITALAHKISNNPAIKSQHPVFGIPSSARTLPHTPPAASRQRPKAEYEGAEKSQKDASKPESLLKAKGQRTEAQERSKPADLVLPPISFPPRRPHSTSSPSQHPSLASKSQITQIYGSRSKTTTSAKIKEPTVK